MGNWKYFELIGIFYQALFASMAQGVLMNEAIHYVYEDFRFMPKEKNVLSNFIITIQYINVLSSLKITLPAQLVNSFHTQLENVREINLEEYLDQGEIEHLTESINEVKYKI